MELTNVNRRVHNDYVNTKINQPQHGASHSSSHIYTVPNSSQSASKERHDYTEIEGFKRRILERLKKGQVCIVFAILALLIVSVVAIAVVIGIHILKEDQIDGGWNAWAAWTSCTVTCNSGLKTRQRQCANPRPSGGGQYCDGAPIEVVECNQNRCPRAKYSFTVTIATRLFSGILSFAGVLLNEGSNFDGSSGTFTCQHLGLYFFTASVVEGGIRENSVSCYIRRNDSDQVRLRYWNAVDSTNTRTSNGYGAATGSATLHLTDGDRVHVWCGTETSEVTFSSFTGFLIAEDP